MQQLTPYLVFIISLEIFLLCTPIIFVVLDFWSGIRKAKVRGERITSTGYRRSLRKLSRYYNIIFAMAFLDIIQMSWLWAMDNFWNWHVPYFPFLTMIATIVVAAIEVNSIYEPADAKEQRQLDDLANIITTIYKNRKDLEGLLEDIKDYQRTHLSNNSDNQ